jgi:hypothetical protein
MDSDGTQLKPWTTIQAGVDAAAAGAIVAIAAGSYLEDVTVTGKPARIWGVCPALVEIVGTGVEPGAIVVLTGGAGTEVRSLAVQGDSFGVVSSGSLDVLLERVWIHDNAGRGVDVEGFFGATSMVLRGVLIEQNQDLGVYTFSADSLVEASVVRATQPNALGLFGHGLSTHVDPTTGVAATLTLRSSLVEQNHEAGVTVGAAGATIEASVIRTTELVTQTTAGGGVTALTDPTGKPATLELYRSIVEENGRFGVFAEGSELIIEASVVRATGLGQDGLFGRGVSVQRHSTGTPATLALRTSLIGRTTTRAWP